MISFIYICSFCFFFTYGKKYWVFQAILFDIISRILNKAFWSVWKRCFSPVVLKVFCQNTCSDQLYVNLNFEFDKTAILFLFFIVFFLFVLVFFEDIISKIAAARRMDATIEGIKRSCGSVLIFLNGLLLVRSTRSQ